MFSDALGGFPAIKETAQDYAPNAVKGRKRLLEIVFRWANPILGNLKTSLVGVHHKSEARYLPRYFGLLLFLINCRFNQQGLLCRLLRAAASSTKRPLGSLR